MYIILHQLHAPLLPVKLGEYDILCLIGGGPSREVEVTDDIFFFG